LDPGIDQAKTKRRNDYEIRGKNLGRICLAEYEIPVHYLTERNSDLIPVWCQQQFRNLNYNTPTLFFFFNSVLCPASQILYLLVLCIYVSKVKTAIYCNEL